MKRFLLVTLLLLLALVIAGGAALRYYARSQRMARRVEGQLKAIYGGPVRVGEVDVGLGGSTVSAFELFEEGNDDKKGDPWLKIDSLTTDISLWDLLAGNAFPKSIKISGAVLMLRFDKAGNLLTRFPGEASLEQMEQGEGGGYTPPEPGYLPTVDIEKSEVVFRKDGQPELRIKNVSGRFNNEKALAGTGESAEVGRLALHGSFKDSSQATVQLQTSAKTHVTQALLNRLPFVPAEIWQDIQVAEGDTSAKLNLQCDLQALTLRFVLELDPENTRFAVPALDLHAEKAAGRVTIDDDHVQLRDLKAHTAGGIVLADAELRFRETTSRLKFTRIKVIDLTVEEVPAEWNLPPALRKSAKGKLSGNAVLEVTVTAVPAPLYAAALVGMTASASDSAWLPAIGMLATYRARLVQARGEGKGQVRDPADHHQPIDFDWQPPLMLRVLYPR